MGKSIKFKEFDVFAGSVMNKNKYNGKRTTILEEISNLSTTYYGKFSGNSSYTMTLGALQQFADISIVAVQGTASGEIVKFLAMNYVSWGTNIYADIPFGAVKIIKNITRTSHDLTIETNTTETIELWIRITQLKFD